MTQSQDNLVTNIPGKCLGQNQKIVLFPASLAKNFRVGGSEKDFISYFVFILF